MAEWQRADDALPEPEPNYVLYTHIDNRRQELRLTWDDVAAAAGLHRQTLHNLRSASKVPRPLTLRGIEAAMRWEQGSADDILAGAEPTILADTHQPPSEQIRHAVADIRAQLRTALDEVEARLDDIESQLKR